MQLSWECKKLSHNILRTDWTRKKVNETWQTMMKNKKNLY